MAKCTSPARIAGRNFFFCASVPYSCRVGPTVCSVTAGSGTSARAASLTKMDCSSGPKPLPAVLLGPAHTELAVGAHPLDDRAVSLTVPVDLHLGPLSGEMRFEKYCRSSACSCRCSGVVR